MEASQAGRTLRARRPPASRPNPDDEDDDLDDDYEEAEDEDEDGESSEDEVFEEGTSEYVEPSRR